MAIEKVIVDKNSWLADIVTENYWMGNAGLKEAI